MYDEVDVYNTSREDFVCAHEEAKAADECLLEVIGSKNTEHFFFGTQDVEFRRKLQQESIVPLMFCLRNILLIDQPSDFQRQTANNSERKRLHMTEKEKKLLEIQTARIIASNREDGASECDQWEPPRVVDTRNGLGVKDKTQFKRKRAKGPNPLSCKKKKKENNTEKPRSKPKGESKSGGPNDKKEGAESGTRKRSRKRSRKSGPERTE
ncbi:unnamed protein product [Cochlearia groenlandica]